MHAGLSPEQLPSVVHSTHVFAGSLHTGLVPLQTGLHADVLPPVPLLPPVAPVAPPAPPLPPLLPASLFDNVPPMPLSPLSPTHVRFMLQSELRLTQLITTTAATNPWKHNRRQRQGIISSMAIGRSGRSAGQRTWTLATEITRYGAAVGVGANRLAQPSLPVSAVGVSGTGLGCNQVQYSFAGGGTLVDSAVVRA